MSIPSSKQRTSLFSGTGCAILFAVLLPATGTAQYPDIVDMNRTMAGNVTVKARHMVRHLPGFHAGGGVVYKAMIDPEFQGSGTPYVDPPPPQTQSITPSANQNYIITYVPQIAGYSPSGTCNSQQVNVDIQYFDGLGRESQTVSVMASPGQKDLIAFLSYDPCGRPEKKYLPYESANQDGRYDVNALAAQKTFIRGLYGPSEEDFGFSQTEYEPSPLNRVVKTAAPGQTWSLSQSDPALQHFQEISYETNTAALSCWNYENNTLAQLTYEPNQLFVTVTMDENRGAGRAIVREYKDKSDRLVMSERVDNSGTLSTRYVYDEIGMLRCVVPPKSAGPSANPGINDLCYYYTYDGRHRMSAKKLPDAGWQYIVYDQRDRMLLTQDAKMRAENSSRWILTCYDALNRPVLTGFYIHTSALSGSAMQDHVASLNMADLIETRTTGYNNTEHGYTRNTAATLGGGSSNFEVLTVSYYDDYAFRSSSYQYGPRPEIGLTQSELQHPVNMLTGTKTRVMNTEAASFLNSWMLTVHYYNEKYFEIQTVSDNQVSGGKEVQSTAYSFTGRIEKRLIEHDAFSNPVSFVESYTYDHRGRLIEKRLDGPLPHPVVLTRNAYDQTGRLMIKLCHAELSGDAYSPFIQKTDYSYNIRDWLTGINDPFAVYTEKPVFSMRLAYEGYLPELTTTPQYNGNIAAACWTTGRNDDRYAYAYSYDRHSRLLGGLFYQNSQAGWVHDNSFDERNISYDANGNILSLNRYASSAAFIDQLNYMYLSNSNKIFAINDLKGDVPGLNDYRGHDLLNNYQYDVNGNMVADYSKNITVPIQYTFLNKPELVDFGNGEKILYLYDANGAKLGKKVMDGNVTSAKSMIYVGNFIYSWSGALLFIQTEEGRLVPESNAMRMEYFAKDHLGNTRATYAYAAPGLPQTMEYHHYYPFGMTLEALDFSTQFHPANNFLYNTKELQEDYGLQWYDYGARFYDPQLGRWHSVDPMAEKYFNLSPYNYTANNPLLFIDPNGEEIWLSFTRKNEKGNESTTQYQYKDNRLYSKNGDEYNGSDNSDPIFQLVKDQLNFLKSDEGGGFGDLISTLESDDAITTTIDINLDTESNQEQNDGFWGTDSKITYNPLNPEDRESGNERNPMIGLIHELQHSSDRNISGDYDPSLPTTDINGNKSCIGYKEARAVRTENSLRGKLGSDQRETYRYNGVDVIVPKPYVYPKTKKK